MQKRSPSTDAPETALAAQAARRRTLREDTSWRACHTVEAQPGVALDTPPATGPAPAQLDMNMPAATATDDEGDAATQGE